MAMAVSSKLAFPTFVGLRAGEVAKPAVRCTASSSSRPVRSTSLTCVASIRDKAAKILLGASAAVLLGASAASAAEITVKMGDDNGALLFVPNNIKISAGDTVTFVNNASFPHNVIFDEDEVPSGVNADSLSHEDLLNAKGETFTVTLSEKGTYKFYCLPHMGAGMVGEVTVN